MNTVEQEGYDAYLEGSDDNPYDSDNEPEEWESWEHGWDLGFENGFDD